MGASGFGPNISTRLTFNRVRAHDMRASHGIANYNSVDTTVTDGVFENNGTGTGSQGGVGINCEGSLGVFTFRRCTSRGNTLAATRIDGDANSFGQGGATTRYVYDDCVLTAGTSDVAVRYDGRQANDGGLHAEFDTSSASRTRAAYARPRDPRGGATTPRARGHRRVGPRSNDWTVCLRTPPA